MQGSLSLVADHCKKAVTSNYRQIWPLSYPMIFVVPSIVEVLMNKISLWIVIHSNDLAAENLIWNFKPVDFMCQIHWHLWRSQLTRPCEVPMCASKMNSNSSWIIMEQNEAQILCGLCAHWNLFNKNGVISFLLMLLMVMKVLLAYMHTFGKNW